MFDDDPLSPRFDSEPSKDSSSKESKAKYIFKGLPDHELVALRDEITQLLPPLELANINLEEEMLLQLRSTRSLQNEIIGDHEVPVNQKAQVANSVSATLVKLSELQEKLYTTERLKRIEKSLITAVSKLPDDLIAEFMSNYKVILDDTCGSTR